MLKTAFLALALSSVVSAQATAWTGATSSDWFDPANWSSGVPDPSTSVVINGAGISPVLSGTGECLHLTVGTFTLWTLNGTLDVYGNANGGSLPAGSGAVRIRGNGPAATLSGQYRNLEVFDRNATLTGNVVGSLEVTQAVTTIDPLPLFGFPSDIASTHVGAGGTLIATGSELGDVVLEGAATIRSDCDVDALTVDGGSLDVTAVPAGTTAFEIQGSLRVLNGGAIANISGAPLRLLGQPGVEVEVTGSMPAIDIADGDHHLFNLNVVGPLRQLATAGDLRVRDVRIRGDAEFLGGTVLDDGPSSILTIDCDATWDTTALVITPPRIIRVDGDWSSSSMFDLASPASQRILIRGTGTHSFSSNGRLDELEIANGADVQATGETEVGDILQVNSGCSLTCAKLRSLGSATIDGDLILLAGQDHIMATVDVAGTVDNQGQLTIFGDAVVDGMLLDADYQGDLTVNGFATGCLRPGGSNSSSVVVSGTGSAGLCGVNDASTDVQSDSVTLVDVSVGGSGFGFGFFEVYWASVTIQGDVTIGDQIFYRNAFIDVPAGQILRCGGFIPQGFTGASINGTVYIGSGVYVPPTNGFGGQGGVIRFDSGGGSLGKANSLKSQLSAADSLIIVENGAALTLESTSPFGGGGIPEGYVALGAVDVTDGNVFFGESGSLVVPGIPMGAAARPTVLDDLHLFAAGNAFSNGPDPVFVGGEMRMDTGSTATLLAGAEIGSVDADTGTTVELIQATDGSPFGAPIPIAITVHGDLSCLGTMTPAGVAAVVDGTDNVLRGSLPPTMIDGTYAAENVTILGDLVHSPGAGPLDLGPVPANTVTVQGDALLDGTSVLATESDALFEVDGNLDWQPDAATSWPQVVRVGGDATFDGTFGVPAGGALVLDGSGPQSLTHPGTTFGDVVVEAGSMTTTTAVNADGDVDVDGSLVLTSGALICDTLDVTGSLDLQTSSSHAVRDSLLVSGTLAVPSSAFLTLTGTGSRTIDSDSSNVLPITNITGGDTVIAEAHAFIFVTQPSAGSLEVGQMVVDNDTAIRGTVFSGSGPGSLLDSAFNLVLEPSQLSDSPPELMRVGARFDVNENFVPTSGTVELVGSAAQSIRAIGTATTIALHDLHVRGGVRTAEAPLTLHSLRIDAGAELIAQAGSTVSIAAGQSVIIDGILRLPQGADLVLGAGASLHVGTTGAIVLDGQLANRSEVRGQSSSMLIEGSLVAENFTFEGSDALGVRVAASATFGPSANTLIGGRFVDGEAGGVLLDLTRNGAATLLLEFDFDSAGSGVTTNVRAAGTAAITMSDAAGDLAGEAFEDDPGGIVTWSPSGTVLADLSVAGATFRVTLSFTTLAEDTSTFRWVRDTVPATSEVALPAIAAVGPSTYASDDTGLTAGTRYRYRLERLSSLTGAWRPLGSAEATPRNAQEGNTLFVGPGGFSDITSALAAAGSGATIVVETGDYGAFDITQPVRILAEPGTRVIGGGPVNVTNIGALDGPVLLDGLEITTSIVLTNVLSTVILHDLEVSGAGDPGVTITGCPKVAVQQLVTTRRIDAVSSELAFWDSSVGTVDLQSASTLTHIGLAGETFVLDGTSSEDQRIGMPATLEAELLWPQGSSQDVELEGAPFDLFIVFFGGSYDYFDLSPILPIDMRLLLPLSPPLATLGDGALDASGEGTVSLTVPSATGLAGSTFALQVLTVGALPGRFGETVAFVIVP